MTTKWNDASITPKCGGFYKVRVRFNAKPEHEATAMSAEWLSGEWWLEISTGPHNGDQTPDITLREMAEEPGVVAMLARINAARAIC